MNTDEVFKNVTVIKSKRKTVELSINAGGSITLRVPLRATKVQIRQFVEGKTAWIEKQLKNLERTRAAMEADNMLTENEIAALCEKAKKELPERVSRYARLIGVDYGKIIVRCQKTRWGSCNKKGDLSFNCLLMLLPEEIADSVIVHELCHRKQMDHSQKFYAEVLSVMPDYRSRDKWLKKNGGAVIMRAHSANRNG